jgi:hypothetical protein
MTWIIASSFVVIANWTKNDAWAVTRGNVTCVHAPFAERVRHSRGRHANGNGLAT